jgi:DNA-binding NarL/FixJ family response regulator
MSNFKSILLCDDHTLFGSGISELLTNNGYDVTAVSSSDDCITFIKHNQYDVFLCDLNIDQKTGFEIYEQMKVFLKKTNAFLLTSYYEDFLIQKAQKIGFSGYLTKETSIEELILAIEMQKGDPFFTTLTPILNNAHIEGTKDFSINKIKLSKQEKEIIKWIVKGKKSKEIALILFISKATVETHRRNINRKLELKTIGSLIQYAHENNLID